MMRIPWTMNLTDEEFLTRRKTDQQSRCLMLKHLDIINKNEELMNCATDNTKRNWFKQPNREKCGQL